MAKLVLLHLQLQQRLINEGAAYLVVPGNPPNGCSPTMLTFRSSLNRTDNYDYIGCLNDINRVARRHNSFLRLAIGALRVKYPHTTIIFADFYHPIISIIEKPNRFGNVLSRFALLTSIAAIIWTML
jgi:phospholipase/lecithinase/hemolysin